MARSDTASNSASDDIVKRLRNILVLAVLLGLTSLLLSAVIENGHPWGDDFAAYIMQGQSLVRGNPSAFLVANRFTIEQSSDLIGPIAYPWGFPLLLAPIYAFFGMSLVAFKTLNIVCYLAFLVLLWFAWPQCYSGLSRLVFVSLFAWNPNFQEFMNQVLSDIPFLLFSTLSIILIRRVAVERRWLISEIGDHFLLGLVIAAAYFIRTNGLLLVITLALTQFITVVRNALSVLDRTSDRLAQLRSFLPRVLHTKPSNLWLPTLPYVSFALAVVLWRALLPEGESSYLWQFKTLSLSLILEHIHYYIDSPTHLLNGLPHRDILYGATIPLAIGGMFQRRASDFPMIFYGALTLLLFVLWPPLQGVRFLFPILPFYTYFVLIGLERSGATTMQRWRVPWRLVRLSPAFLVLFYFVRISVANATMNWTEQRPILPGPYLPTSQQVFSFIGTSTEPESIIVFFKPRAMRLFTERPSIMIKEADKIIRGDYLCVYLREDAYNQVTLDDVGGLLEKGKLTPVYQNADFRVYRINKSHNKSTHSDREIAPVRPAIPVG
jgi:hypothetical protein